MAWGTSDQIEGQARLLTYGEDARPPKLADHAMGSRVWYRRRGARLPFQRGLLGVCGVRGGAGGSFQEISRAS